MTRALRRTGVLLVLLLAVLSPLLGDLHACPFCEGTDGVNPVRQEVFGPSFGPNLLAVTAPLLLCLAAGAAVVLAVPAGGSPSGKERSP